MSGVWNIPLMVAETILSPWLVLPLAVVTMLVVGAHVLSVEVSVMPLSRKRLRIANGLLMMLVTGALAYALAIVPVVVDARANPTQARAFVVVWLVIIAMLTIVVVIAGVEILGTLGAGYRQHRALRREYRERSAREKRANEDGARG